MPVMLVKKFKLDKRQNTYELIKEIDNVDEEKVFIEMATDFGYEDQADYKYEAGHIVNGKFDPAFIFFSENPNMFD